MCIGVLYLPGLARKINSMVKTKKRSKTKLQKFWKNFKKDYKKTQKKVIFLRSPYVLVASIVLAVTTALWSTLGAMTQSANADQLINSYLFNDAATLSGAVFPGAHSFLLKWPLFFAERLLGHSQAGLVLLTVFVSAITVVGLAYIMYRIDRRPIVFGTALLALSSILLLVPAEPYSGSLLPASFAMLTTRNIEYLVYILSIVLLIRSAGFIRLQFGIAVVLLAILVASDRLFLWLSLGGAVIMGVLYLIRRRKIFVQFALRWGAATVASFVLALVMLWIINSTGVTHIDNNGSPYGFISSLKDVGLGCIYVISSIATNLGANPAFDSVIAKDIPSVAIGRLASPLVIPVVVNIGLLLGGLYGAARVVIASTRAPKVSKRSKKPERIDTAVTLSVALIASTIAAIGLFVLTSHYYAVDSRYVTIGLFAVVIGGMTYVRTLKLPSSKRFFYAAKSVLGVAIIVGCAFSVISFQQHMAKTAQIDERNAKVVQVLQTRKTDLLIGDYWRVVPIGQMNNERVDQVLPMSDCTTVRESLSSAKWQKDLNNTSFTYLLTLEPGTTGYPPCSIDTITRAYGRPNASTLIAGTNENPTELLLSYDLGTNQYRDVAAAAKTTTILPNSTDQIKDLSPCTNGNTTVMNIVAHQDDDLLFINPDLLHYIDNKHCVRTVYVTSGDDGQGSQYWLDREKGSEAAYNSMLGLSQDTVWAQRTLKIADGEFATVVNPKGNRDVSILFLRLPDGNLTGKGFKSVGYSSLANLMSGKQTTIKSVDDQSAYTTDTLKKSLTTLMEIYTPNIINTQIPTNLSKQYADHSDHLTVGRYVDEAFAQYANKSQVILKHYIGYPERQYSENVSGPDLDRSTDAFLAYALHDKSVCQTKDACAKTATYNGYLHRQYSN